MLKRCSPELFYCLILKSAELWYANYLSNRITIETISIRYRTFSDFPIVSEQFTKIFRKISSNVKTQIKFCLTQVLIFQSKKIVNEK